MTSMTIIKGSEVAFNNLPDATWFTVVEVDGFRLTLREVHTDYAVQYSDTSLVKQVREATRKVTSLMSGKEVTIPADTPLCCDPSSETYWSM